MKAFQALQVSFVRLWRLWPVALVLWAINFATAACLALLPAAALWGPAHRPAIQTAADGIELQLLLEIITIPVVNQNVGLPVQTPAYQQAVLLLLGVGGLLPFATLLPSAFLHGGAWLTLHEYPQPFSLKRFLWGGAHWYGSFWVLGVAEGLGSLSLAAALAFLVPLVAGWSRELSWALLLMVAGVSLVGFMLCELAGAALIVKGTRNPFSAFHTAAQWLGSSPPALHLTYGVTLFALLFIHLLFRFGLFPVVPLAVWPLALLVQQAFILLRLLARLWRWGSVLAVIG